MNLHDCLLEKIDENHYKYYYGSIWVNIHRNTNGTWYYTRLHNISRSYNDFKTLQICIDAAYEDMITSKY